jgi:hypothetical protein
MEALLVIVGIFYGLAALGYLSALVTAVWFGPSLMPGGEDSRAHWWSVLMAANCLTSGLIAYGLVRLRSWVRYIVALYNGLFLVGLTMGAVSDVFLEPREPITAWGLAYLVVVLAAIGGIVALVSSERARSVMIQRR